MSEGLSFDEGALDRLFEDRDGPVGLALQRVTQRVRTEVIRNLSRPGRGRVYVRGRVRHVASAPGDPPAVDRGRLRASVTAEVTRDARGLVGVVLAGTRYARDLELGTRHMRPRPYLRPALDKVLGTGASRSTPA